jgi:hypothetical protein
MPQVRMLISNASVTTSSDNPLIKKFYLGEACLVLEDQIHDLQRASNHLPVPNLKNLKRRYPESRMTWGYRLFNSLF